MATTGIIDGTLIAIYVGTIKIDVQKSCTLSLSKEPRQSSNKDNAGWKATFGGEKSWEISGEAELKGAATEGFDQLFDAFINDTEVALEFTTQVSGDTIYGGNAQITKLEQTAGTNENASFSYTFTGNGAPTKSTVV